ncbi:MAG TPA: hypothetical protein VJ521_16420, partial [Acidobacteriota bacterium]|nr:hypothetical protein [Acidobacteriota bacterium]
VAASGYLTFGEKEKAMNHLRAAIQLDPTVAQRVYDLGKKAGLRLPELIAITPSSPAGMVQLTQYLVSNGETGPTLKTVLQNLGTMTLSGPQRIDLIRYALNAEHYDIAAEQAKIASSREDTRAEGFASLAEIAWRKNDLSQFERFSAQAEKSYLDHAEIDKAAQSALEASSRLISRQDKISATRRLESLLNRYPRYAPAFFQMSAFHQDNPETQLYYLEKAVALDPAAYQKELAAAYLRVGKFAEAEEIYKRLVAVPENQVEAYQGWARCRIAQGNLLGAMDILKTAIDRTGGASALILQLAEAYDSFGDYQNAALTYQAYARSEPGRFDGYLRAAEVYMKLAQYWRAREQYLKVLEHDPNHAEARSKLSYLESIGY